jgi:PKD repeat protein
LIFNPKDKYLPGFLFKYDTMNNEKIGMIIGIFLLVFGIVILLWVLTSAMAIVQSPGTYLEEQFPQEEGSQEGPNARFSWNTNDLSVDFQDESEEGDAAISNWEWDFGDGETSYEQNPHHTFNSDGDFNVGLIVEDENGESSSTHADVYVEFGNNDGGRSEGEFGDISFEMGNFMLPLAGAFLLGMLHLVMFLIGAALVKGGWNLIKQGPSTLKLKIKPKRLEVEQAAGQPEYSYQSAPAPNSVVAQHNPAYSPAPASAAVIASMESLPRTHGQPAQAPQPTYVQPNQANYYQSAPAPQPAPQQPPPIDSPQPTPEPQLPNSQTDIMNYNPPSTTPQQEMTTDGPPLNDPPRPREEPKVPQPVPNVAPQQATKQASASSQPRSQPQRQTPSTTQGRGRTNAPRQAYRGSTPKSSGTKGRGAQAARKPPSKGKAKPKGRGKGKGRRKGKKR